MPDNSRPRAAAVEHRRHRLRWFVWVSLAVFVALAVLHTWPLALAPSTLSRNDNFDTVLHEWTLAWLAHQIVRDPVHLFDANIFYPDRLTLAYSDHLFIPGIFVAPLIWAGFSPVLVYNLLLIAGLALTGWMMSLVIHRWTGSRMAGLISGSLVAFNSFTMTRFPQIQDQHLEFLPLALWTLDRLIRVPSVRHAFSLAWWFVLQALTSGYWLLFTTVAMVAGAAVRPGEWTARTHRAFMPYATLAGVVAGVAMLPFLVPYWTVSREQGLTRSLEEVSLYSAHISNYLSTGSRMHFDAWSHTFYGYGGDSLFPGVLALILVAVAVGSGIAFRDVRARMAVSFGVVAFALSFGPSLPGYAVLYEIVPLMQGIRGASRFGQLWLVAIAILAGFGWERTRHALVRAAMPAARHVVLPVGAAVLVGIHAEALVAPVEYTEYRGNSSVWEELRNAGDGAVLVFFPFYPLESVPSNARYMLYSTGSFPPMLNGYSGFTPQSYQRHVEALRVFPYETSIDYLREVGVTHVIVQGHLMSAIRMGLIERSPALQIAFTDGSLRIYVLKRP
jgi:hypothetical protein